MPYLRHRTLATYAVVALASVGLTTLPQPVAAAADEDTSQVLVSGPELDSRVIFQDFSFYQPYESNTYTTLADKAGDLDALGITDVWMAPPYRALDAYNEEGYAVTDRYDLGEFPAGHDGATATKYGTSTELKAAVAALHAEGLKVQTDIVPNQVYLYQDREVVPVTAVDQWGTPNRADVVNKLYEVYTVGGGAGAQKYGQIKTWKSTNLNGISNQELGTDRVMLDADGTPYRYLGGDPTTNGNYVPAGGMRTAPDINNIDGYLTVDGYYIAGQRPGGGDIYRSNLLWYVDTQGGTTSTYLDYVRAHPPVGSGIVASDSNGEVRVKLIYATTDQAAVDTTNDYIGSQPGYNRTSEAGITALRFDDGDTGDVNKNLLQYEFLIGQDVDNSDATVQADQTNWEEFLLDQYDFDGFRWDAAGHYNKEILQNSADLMRERSAVAGTDAADNLSYIESYVDEQVPFLNQNGNPQLAYDTSPYYAFLDALGEAQPERSLTDVFTTSKVDRIGETGTAIPNWSFVTNHDTEHNDMAVIPVTSEEAGGQPYGTKAYQLAQYAKYTADRKRATKQYAPYNVPAAYAIALTNKDTVPSVFYGDLWEAADSYMKTRSPYYDAITDLLEVRTTNVSGKQVVNAYASNLSDTAGQDLISSVREGTDRASGIGVVVGNDARMSTTIEVPMGAAHGNQEYVDALGFRGETLTTDAEGTLTVDIDGVRNVQVNGYLAAWVPKSEEVVTPTDPTGPTDPVEPPVTPTDPDTGPIASTTRLLVASRRVAYGQSATLAAAVPVGATGTVTFAEGTRTLATATVEDGTVTASTPDDLSVGTHRITARYSGDDVVAASTSTTSTLVVTRATTTARVTRVGNVGGGKRFQVRLAALANGEPVTGTVRVLVGGKVVQGFTLRARSAGTRTVVLRRSFPTNARVRVRYLGSALVRPATSPAVRITTRR
ncbi:Ig-like domain repeat protein [Nocardioides sp.]|uniref:Ig-like domain repeat protein n=1 Tax=Nocardioides sp. TaxID=35761 RepID=UPI0027279E40|nr:Ig-like domain repeat protein [Nocardioides sp.]MDO9456888.1 glycoside hydrolase family 70 protein [Nocardioides sp.]